ncbi:MAG: DUF4331 family protein [Bacteroidetes bacterium]|nr:DUF4331 family protein [Bacteroidota bacterium]MBS1608327.1 DUF4331 family protein [Bacteroidota bacterium]
MKKKILFGTLIGIAAVGSIIFAADHIDAPAVTGTGNVSLGTDITDVYAFQSPADNNNMVFVINTQGLLSPSASATAKFPENTLYELNIDNTGDNVEDMVIQLLVRNGKVRAYGPVAPAAPGTGSIVVANAPYAEASVTSYASGSPVVGTSTKGVKVFAGPRDDPFFFDLKRFKEIIAGTATKFHDGTAEDPATDAFAGTNVMSLVVEVPKSMLGSASSINVWAESKSK